MVAPTVGDVMTGPVVTVREDAGGRAVIGALVDNEVSAVVVVDATGRLMGCVSEGDLLPQVAGWGTRRGGGTARDLMSGSAVTIGPEASIATAARLMDDLQLERLPVVDERRQLIG